MSLSIAIFYGSVRTERQGIRADKFLTELEWYARALKAAREQECRRSECDTFAVGSTSR